MSNVQAAYSPYPDDPGVKQQAAEQDGLSPMSPEAAERLSLGICVVRGRIRPRLCWRAGRMHGSGCSVFHMPGLLGPIGWL
ncbi:MAG: hypothetical protein AMK73_01865 [Planctomycetes bacterium SM23_32]|nr:MAG: hypothetical protein AMK73_01865 [Planctomycetes bacterium SM23_32]